MIVTNPFAKVFNQLKTRDEVRSALSLLTLYVFFSLVAATFYEQVEENRQKTRIKYVRHGDVVVLLY